MSSAHAVRVTVPQLDKARLHLILLLQMFLHSLLVSCFCNTERINVGGKEEKVNEELVPITLHVFKSERPSPQLLAHLVDRVMI